MLTSGVVRLVILIDHPSKCLVIRMYIGLEKYSVRVLMRVVVIAVQLQWILISYLRLGSVKKSGVIESGRLFLLTVRVKWL